MTSIVSKCCGTFHFIVQSSVLGAERSNSAKKEINVSLIARRGSISDKDGSRTVVTSARKSCGTIALSGFRPQRGKGSKASHLRVGSCGRLSDPGFQFETDSRSPSDVGSYARGVDSKRLQTDESSSIDGRSCDEGEKYDHSWDPEISGVQNVVQGERKPGDQRQSGEGSSIVESELQGRSGTVRMVSTEEGDKATVGSEDDSKSITAGRKRMGRPRKKKKKAYCAGIAMYDPSSNSVRLKEGAPGMGTISPGAQKTEQRGQGSSRWRTDQPLEQDILGKETKTNLKGIGQMAQNDKVPPLNETDAGGVVKSRSARKPFGAEVWTPLSRLQGLKENVNIEQNLDKSVHRSDDEGTGSREEKSETDTIGDTAKMTRETLAVVRPTRKGDDGLVKNSMAYTDAVSIRIPETSMKQQSMDSLDLNPNPKSRYAGLSATPLPWETITSLQSSDKGPLQQPTCGASKANIQSKFEAPDGQVRKPVARTNTSNNHGSECEVSSLRLNGIANKSASQIADGVIPTSQSVKGQVEELVLEVLPKAVAEQTSQTLQTKVVEPILEVLPETVVEQVGQVVYQTSQSLKEQVVEPVLEVLPEVVVEQVGQVVHQVKSQVNEQVQQVRTTASIATESVTSTAGQVAESITSTATQVTKSITATAVQVSSSLTEFLNEEIDSDDEFEAFTSNIPEFRGVRGLDKYEVLQEDQGILVQLYDFYSYMLKKPLPEFATGMFAAPIALSVLFTLLYLPQFEGLAFDETARNFLDAANGAEVDNGGSIGLKLSWTTLFEVFMFSLSLSTGLEPELAPLSPYTLVVANLNALLAQLIFAFLSGAVFARLSQPSQPVRCSKVALIYSHGGRRRQAGMSAHKALMTRCVLAGPQPCELVDVKVDLMYKFNTVTNGGSYFRASQSLKLVRPQISYLDHGMLVRHVIDESSPLHCQTPESLCQEDAIFVLSVAGMERSSMQPIFHVQYYCVYDGDLIWDAEFEDMILINQKNQRILDHSKLSLWRPL